MADLENEMMDPTYHKAPVHQEDRIEVETFALSDLAKGLLPEAPTHIVIDLRNGWLKLRVTCTECEKDFFLDAQKDHYNAWKNGTLIQNAFPYLNEGQRELLLSGICGDCFDKLFEESPSEEGEDDPIPF